MRCELKIPLTIKDIKSAVGALHNDGVNDDMLIRFISTDTRTIQTGDLFFPLKGENFDGENFVDEARRLHAYTVSAKYSNADIPVADCTKALMHLAEYYKTLLPLKATVAITGSVGKTTTRELAAHIISAKYKVHSSYENFNNEIGVPLTVLAAPKDTEILILEAGMNHKGELSVISKTCKPTIAAITKIGYAHVGNLGTREMIAKAKMEITDGMENGILIIPYGEPLLQGYNNTVTVSVSNPEADVFLFPSKTTLGCIEFDYYSKKCTLLSRRVTLLGTHISECLSMALAIAEKVGLSESEISSGIERIPKELSRGKIIKLKNLTVLDDSYNSSPEAIISALDTLDMFPGKKKSALLGDMLELGSKTEELHKRIGEACAAHKLDKLYTFGVYSQFIAEGAENAGMAAERIFKNPDITAPYITAKLIANNSEPDEIILFKASHRIGLNKILDILKDLLVIV